MDELNGRDTPLVVRNWTTAPPEWIEVRHTSTVQPDTATAELGACEAGAIALATKLHAGLPLMDHQCGAAVYYNRKDVMLYFS